MIQWLKASDIELKTMTRRNFLFGSAALAATTAVGRARDLKPNLRVGILSDIHVTGQSHADIFKKALRYYDSIKVDAVMIAGDLTTWSKLEEFELVAKSWYEVFPGDRRSDGEKVERLFVTGNHDVDGFAYDGAKFKTLEEAKPKSFYFHREEFWRRLFHEDYRQLSVKTVKGYSFVLRNWVSMLRNEPLAKAAGCLPEKNGLGAFLAAQDLPKDKPFFYLQHDMPNDTVNASWLVGGARWGNGHDDGESTKHLSKYPNVIAFSGHCHNSLCDEMSIWQGAFTAVNCGCTCGFTFTPPGRENGWNCDDFNRDPPFEMARFPHDAIHEGIVMEVFDDAVVLERREFLHDHVLGPDWVIPLGKGAAKPYTVAARFAAAKAPAFPKGAKVTVKEGEGCGRSAAGTGRAKEKHPQIFVSFPPARTLDGSPARGWDYSVRCELVAGDIVRTLCERCVFSEGAFFAEEDETKPVVCAFAKTDVPAKLNARQKIRFAVTPRSCWGKAGAPIFGNL